MMLSAAVSVPVLTGAAALAQQQDTGGQGEDFGKSSPVGLLLMLVFLIAVVLLVRSMTKHLKRVPASFDGEPDAPAGDRSDDGPESGAAGNPAGEPGKAETATAEKAKSEGS
ncbi:hypothetical protein ACFS2C_05670 [Prauserella oleivorans]|uniref:Preprotein translocase subunit SecG n=1 Tax=Prauserella oleivorans TaxID=1478153 RepID=A0ABW5W6Y3_9PSEU